MNPLGGIMATKHWWKNLPPPEAEEPVLILYLPWNLLHHGDVTPERRMWLLKHFGDVLSVFEGSGIPVHMSYQRVDIEALSVVSDFDEMRLQNLPLLSAPYSHVLCGLIGDDYNPHIDWQIENGVRGNVQGEKGEVGYFFPEWDIPADPSIYFHADPNAFVLSVGAFATLYSECAVGDRVDNSVMRFDAIQMGRQIAVPMKGVEGFHRAWFAYQLNDSEGNLADVIAAVRAIVMEPKNAGKVVTLFVDGESILVGGARSFFSDYPLKGYELWARFFSALASSGLARFFHGMERAYPRWSAAARAMPTGKRIGRHYNKWCSWKTQEKIKRRYVNTLPQKSAGKSAHFLAGLNAVSDSLSVTNAMELNRKGALRTFTDKDGVTFTIGFDLTVPMVGWRAGETLSGKGSFLTQMKKLKTQAPEKFAQEGVSYGKPEDELLDLIVELYLRREEEDVS